MAKATSSTTRRRRDSSPSSACRCARRLGKQKIISEDESARMVRALEQIASEIAAGTFAWPADAEDVHSAIERVLTERIGPLGGKLHTARSRNDQIALDLRLFVIE